MKYPTISESERLLERAVPLIPSATQTLAKGPGQHVRGVAPVFASRGKGARLWDVDGNEYLDYTMGVGPLILGYGVDAVDEAIRAQLEDGITFSLMHPLEVEVAEMIRSIVPGAERVRYSKTGADVTSAAIRLARAYTGRSIVLCCGYHGWHDWYIAVTDRNAGIPVSIQDDSYTFAYNDLSTVLEALDDQVAAVILEPTVFDAPSSEFLHELREACTRNGTLLIFDEMWTGFRLSLGGAQEYFGVRADLACFSKAVANGMPLSVLTGRADVMDLLDGQVFFYTTFGGEALSLAAAKATMTVLQEPSVLSDIHRTGQQLADGLQQIIQHMGIEYITVKGFACRTMVGFDPHAGDPLVLKSFVQQEFLRHAVLWGGFHNVSWSHTADDVAHTLEAYGHVLHKLHEAVQAGTVAAQLRGKPMEPVFRKTGSFHVKPRQVGGLL
jgi:glutamate-1-semialdehyde 2,1-aminomutase